MATASIWSPNGLASAASSALYSYIYKTANSVLRDVQSRLRESASLQDFGVVGDGTDETALIQKALDDCAGVARLYIPTPDVFYGHNDTLRIPSDTYLYGDGKGSLFKCLGSTVRNKSSFVTGFRGDHRSNIVMRDFAVDYNSDRWTNENGTGLGEDADQTCVGICNSSNVVVRNVYAYNGYKHCFDVQAPSYVETSELATEYDTEPSYNVWVENCYATGGGDDNFTTHHSHSIWLTDCLSENPSGVRVEDNHNCYEIDDGSRNVTMTGCKAVGGVCGLQIKGHNYAPAPYNIIVSDFTTINNIIGVEVRHTGYYGDLTERFNGAAGTYTLDSTPYSVDDVIITVSGVLKTPTTDYTLAGNIITEVTPFAAGTRNVKIVYPVASDGDSTTGIDENGDPFTYTGASPTARNIILSDVQIIAPRNTSTRYSGPYPDGEVPPAVTLTAQYGLRVRSYEHVFITNLSVSDGSLDIAGDFEAFDGLEYFPIKFYGGARSVHVKNISTYGFSTNIGNGPWDASTDTQTPVSSTYISAILTTGSFGGGLFLDGVQITDGPSRGVRATGKANHVFLENYQIFGDHEADPNSFPILFTDSDEGNTQKRIGQGFASGYANTVSNACSSQGIVKSTQTSGGIAASAQLFDEWVLQETQSSNMGAGEGARFRMMFKLEADTDPYEVGNYRFQLADTSGDASRVMDYYLGLSVDGTAVPVDIIKFSGADSGVKTHGASFVKTRTVVASAGTTVLAVNDHMILLTGATTHTFTLPAAADGRQLMMRNLSSGTLTVNRAGADAIDAGTSTTLLAGTGKLFVAVGTTWCTVANA